MECLGNVIDEEMKSLYFRSWIVGIESICEESQDSGEQTHTDRVHVPSRN
jgi:hypothetical protein